MPFAIVPQQYEKCGLAIRALAPQPRIAFLAFTRPLASVSWRDRPATLRPRCSLGRRWASSKWACR